MKVIVGLGNIGDEYQNTRHNIGFMVLDLLCEKLGEWQENKKYKALVAIIEVYNEKILLAKPTTYMNRSGETVDQILKYHPVDLDDMWVVQDDIDLAFGQLKIAKDSGSGGHHGIDSIIAKVGRDFLRFRIGVGKEGNRDVMTADEGAGYVLGKFKPNEKEVLPDILRAVADTILFSLENNSSDAITFYNKKISQSLPMDATAKGGRKAK